MPVDVKAPCIADGAILATAASNTLGNSCRGIMVAPAYPSDVVMEATFFFSRWKKPTSRGWSLRDVFAGRNKRMIPLSIAMSVNLGAACVLC